MSREIERFVLWGDFLRGCPCFSPDGVKCTIEGFSREDNKFFFRPVGSFMGHYLSHSWDEIMLGANRVAVTDEGIPLFFMNDAISRIYCSPNVHNLSNFDIALRPYFLQDYLEVNLLSGEKGGER